MKKKISRRLQQLIALVLITAMLWQTDSMRFFSTAYAAETENLSDENSNFLLENELTDIDVLSKAEEVPVTILGEVESLRGEEEKHFRMSDGSFMAVSYGVPVHYLDEDGNWQDYDNRLSVATDGEKYVVEDIDAAETLKTTTSFYKDLSNGNLFEATNGNTSVTLGIMDMTQTISLSTTGVRELSRMGLEVLPFAKEEEMILVQQFDRNSIGDITVETDMMLGEQISATEEDSKGWKVEELIPENLQDSILYKEVFSDVDLMYTKFANHIKEEIVVKSPQSFYSYDFTLNLSGVEPILNEDGSIYLVDENEVVQYEIPAPFMEDANGRRSYEAQYSLTPSNDGFILNVTADKEWMNDDERAFPVVIDPTIVIVSGKLSERVVVSFVAKGTPDVRYRGEVDVGYTTYHSTKNHEGYLYFKQLPNIPAGMTVVDARFSLWMKDFYQLNYPEFAIGFHEVTEGPTGTGDYPSWITSLTWNTKPDYDDGNVIDYVFASASTKNSYHTWEITELVKKWYIEGTENRTAALVPIEKNFHDTYYAIAAFYAFDSDNNTPPILTVSYRSNVGIEPYYTYQTMGVGNAGTAHIADATGQLKVVNQLVSYASTINPFSLGLVYNSDYFTEDSTLDYQPPTKMGITDEEAKVGQGNIAMKLGPGWTLDIIQTMHAETIGDIEYLCYTDGDGTKHYFVVDDERNAEDGSDKIFYYDEDGLGLKAEITNSTQGNFVMYDDNGNKWTFTSRRLTHISDEAANAYVIGWNSANQITTVVQVNRTKAPTKVAEFTYSGDYVSSITDAAGNVYNFTYNGAKLYQIKKEDTVMAYYMYSGNRLTNLADQESGIIYNFQYQFGKVAKIVPYGKGLAPSRNTSISYPNYSKTVYRTSGMNGLLETTMDPNATDDVLTCYIFDYSGRTVNAYTTDAGNNILGATNAAYLDTEVTKTENASGTVTTTVSKKANRTEKIGSMGVSNPTMFHYGGCENAGWTLLTNTTAGRTASYDTLEHRTGTYSLKMVSSNTDGAYYGSSDTISLKVGDTYTVSAYVKSSDCTSIISEGITLEVKDTAGNWFYGRGLSYITSESIDDGWTRIHVTFTALTAGVHTIYIYAEGTVGTFYIDDVQVEKGQAPGVLNLLKNGSMETDPCGWNGFNGAGYSTGTGWNGSKSMQIIGNPVKEAYIRQDVSINLPATETFVLSGWAKANSVPDNVNKHEDPLQDIDKQYGLRARVLYTDGTKEYHYTPFNPDVSEWQFASLTIVPKCPEKTISTIRVICTFEGNANKAYFDNICLSREAAQTLRYNDDGKLESVTTPGLKADENSYQGGNLIGTQTGGNGTYTYTYDTTYSHRLTAVTDGILTQTMGYDVVGNVSATTIKSNKATESLHITTSATYTNDDNLLASVTDAAGNTVSYIYDNTQDKMTGLPSEVHDGKGNRKEIYYDDQGRVIEEYTSDRVEVWYNYTNGRLTEIEKENYNGNQSYEMIYDAYGNMTGFQVGEQTLATYIYGVNNGYLTDLTYGNGQSVEYSYDLLGRVSRKEFSSGRTVDYIYNSNGQLYSVTDSVSGTVYYTYDSLGRLIYAEDEARGVRYQYQYNTNNQMVGVDICVEGWNSVEQEYHFNGQNNAEKIDGISDGTLMDMQMVTGYMIERGVDALQRLTYRITADGFQEDYYYTPGEGANETTTQVSRKCDYLADDTINDLQYTYDSMGNIARIYDAVSGQSVEYCYDNLNQLTSASYSNGRVENYTYDAVGNLLTFQSGTTTHTYTYGNSDWIDQLTAVDGVALTYDAIGNPLSYYNGNSYTMTWTEGRKLATVTTEDGTTNYLYNADGLRFKKTNPDGSYVIYLATDGVIIGEKHYTSANVLTMNLRYTFDENGLVCGYSTSTDGATWTDYYFIRNLQGDVLQVFRESDNVIVAEYSYDSWGNILSATGEKAEENPFRYRGYYYDSETEFYATGTRYYDPAIGRFINADSQFDDGAGILGYNLFAYCANNPIIYKDETGESITLACVLIGAAIGLTIGAVGGSHYAKYQKKLTPSDGWDYWKYVVFGGIGGGALGGLAGWAFAGTSAAASISWGYYKATTTIGTSAYAIGNAFEKWFYKAYNVVYKQVSYAGYRFDAIYKQSIVELKNYNWGKYSSYTSLIRSFTTQANNYLGFVGSKINGQVIKGVTFCFSSKPPQEIIDALRELGVTVNWLP